MRYPDARFPTDDVGTFEANYPYVSRAGRSYSDPVIALLDMVGPATLVAHSAGASTAVNAATERPDLVAGFVLTASAVVLAGLQLSDEMHGVPFLAKSSPRRQFIFTARDRIETAVDRVRTVYDGRYRYIRNFLPGRPHLMDRRYYDRTNPVRDVMRELHVQGKLTPEQAKVFAPERPEEELYDLKKDRFELHDLSTSEAAKHESALARLRSQLTQWTAETGDLGDQPEPTEAVDATRGRRKKRPRVDPEAPPARESPALDPAPSFESRRPARPLGR